MITAAVGLAILIVALNLAAMVSVVRSVAFTRHQKLLQALLVWLVPVVGATTVLYLASERRDTPKPRFGFAGDANDGAADSLSGHTADYATHADAPSGGDS